jgi:hypothetical protein
MNVSPPKAWSLAHSETVTVSMNSAVSVIYRKAKELTETVWSPSNTHYNFNKLPTFVNVL